MARILIVEDEMIIARDLASILSRLGHFVVGIAKTANEALSFAEDEDVDLALVDIVLKGDRDGVTLAAFLRESYNTKIVFVTSHADLEIVNRAAAVGPHGYIVKPFSEESIFANLSMALADDSGEGRSLDMKALSGESKAWSRLSKTVTDKVQDYVLKNLDKEIALKDLAEISNLSESNFSRRFKLTTGRTPYQYVMHERIEEAKRLLRDTQWSIVEIAMSVGFGSQSHFATAFKKSVGLTPLSYRRL